jgi:hypothetical protein
MKRLRGQQHLGVVDLMMGFLSPFGLAKMTSVGH